MPKINESVVQLSDDEVLALNGKIIALSMIPSLWRQITEREYNRTTAIHAHTSGRIHPMGQNRGRLYFWVHEARAAAPKKLEKRGRPRKSKNDENSERA